MSLAILSNMNMGIGSQPQKKRKKTKEKKTRVVTPCQDGIHVRVFCAFGCGTCYKTLPREVDQKGWAKTLRKLNAHESQRCSCNPNATRVSGKTKAKKKAVVDELIQGWETALLKNLATTMQQQIRFLRALPPATSDGLDVAKQINLLQGSLENTKEFIATITSDEKVREANKLHAAKLAEEERARMLEASSRALSAAEALDSGLGHIWTEPTFQDKDEWRKELDMVIEMERVECEARLNQTDENAVGVFWTEPTQASAAERAATLEQVKIEEEKERQLRMIAPADPFDEALGVFWEDKVIFHEDQDLTNAAEYARTAKLESAERARRLATKSDTVRHRQVTRLKTIWPQFTCALQRRFPGRIVQPFVDAQPSRAGPVKTDVPQLHPFPSKRRRDCVSSSRVNTKNRRLERLERLDQRRAPEPPGPLPLDVCFADMEPLDPLDLVDVNGSLGPVSPPSSFTDNDEFLHALDELLEMDTTLL